MNAEPLESAVEEISPDVKRRIAAFTALEVVENGNISMERVAAIYGFTVDELERYRPAYEKYRDMPDEQ